MLARIGMRQRASLFIILVVGLGVDEVQWNLLFYADNCATKRAQAYVVVPLES